MSYYIYVIYNELLDSCYYENGVIEDFSNLYTNKQQCELAAIDRCKELDEIAESEDCFSYKITELTVIEED